MASPATRRPVPGAADPGGCAPQAQQLRRAHRACRPRLPLRRRARRDARPATGHLDQRRAAHLEGEGQGATRPAALHPGATRRDRRGVRGREPARRASPALGGRRDRRGAPAPGEGATDHHRRGRLASGLGHAAHPARRVRDRREGPAQGARPLSAEPAERPRHRAAPALGAGAGTGAGPAGLLRLRRHARDLAVPSAHRLDGRRRLAVETALRAPEVQLPGRHHLGARHGRRQTAGGRAGRGARRRAVREPAGRGHHPGTAVVLLPTRDRAVRLPAPPAADLDGMVAHELARFAVPGDQPHEARR